MAEKHTRTTPPLRPLRLFIAAGAATVILAVTIVVDLTRPDLEIPSAMYGGGRMVCGVLWVYWFVAYIITLVLRAIGPDSAGYVAGFVDGVARRFPDEDRVSYRGR